MGIVCSFGQNKKMTGGRKLRGRERGEEGWGGRGVGRLKGVGRGVVAGGRGAAAPKHHRKKTNSLLVGIVQRKTKTQWKSTTDTKCHYYFMAPNTLTNHSKTHAQLSLLAAVAQVECAIVVHSIARYCTG